MERGDGKRLDCPKVWQEVVATHRNGGILTKKEAEKFGELLGSSMSAQKVPPGWYTCKEIGEAQGLSASMVSQYMRQGIDRGEIETRKFRILTGDRVYPVPHFKPKK